MAELTIKLTLTFDFDFEAQTVICLSVLERRAGTHTHTFQPGEQRLSRGLYFLRFISKHVPQYSNSKDGILQQSPMMILALSFG